MRLDEVGATLAFMQPLLVAAGLVPLAAMLLATFAAFWLADEKREREAVAPRSRA